MPAEVNCLVTKVLIPFLEREVGPDAGAAVCRAAGRSREWLMADHNWISLALANELMKLGQSLTNEPDEERWTRRFWEYGMDWKPREERSYIGTYTMGFGDPRSLYARQNVFHEQVHRWVTMDLVSLGRRHAAYRRTPLPGHTMPRWACTWVKVTFERFPTNWGLPRARVTESRCAADGADACEIEVRWQNPSLGPWFWTPTITGALAAAALSMTLGTGDALGWAGHVAVAAAVVAGVAVGVGLRERRRRERTQRLLTLQGDEIIYSNHELEKKFRDLETKIEELSLLIDLAAAVNATLDPAKIYEQGLQRLVQGMRYQAAYFFVVDRAQGVIRGRKVATGDPRGLELPDELEYPLDAEHSAVGKVALTGTTVLIDDLRTTTEPFHRATVDRLGFRSLLAAPLRVKRQVVGILAVSSRETGAFGDPDIELVSAVANHVAIALDRAESFRTIEELTRGLEDKVRVRTEQLRSANEELQAAYRELQAAQVQLVQREKMASVGQLVAGVAHELNNPIGFVSSNVATLEEFVKRLRAMVDVYRAVPLPPAEQARVDAQWQALKIDYALKYLDSMILGIKEGAERTRKIVRDLRVFARSDDDVWQPVDLHEEIESSLTLLSHLLKDRVAVRKKLGDLPSVECVRSQIDQVFLNLLANAAQAIAGQGEISIETRCENGFAVVAISDTGPGIAPDVLPRIFDPFFTTKPVGEGTGLGLSISYEIVKKHRGEITAESVPGGGATFVVRLPLTRAA